MVQWFYDFSSGSGLFESNGTYLVSVGFGWWKLSFGKFKKELVGKGVRRRDKEVLIATGFHGHVKCKEMEEAMEPLGDDRKRSNIFCATDFFPFK